MDKPMLKEVPVLSNPFLSEICQCKAWSQWCMYDYMKSKNLTPENFIRGSRIKYENYLEEQRKAQLSNEKAVKVVQESIDVKLF